MTREAWLELMVEKITPLFTAQDVSVPSVRISCVWPSRGAFANKGRAWGECWNPLSAEDGMPQIFISPAISDGPAVAAVLVHELAHAVVGYDAGHKKPFKNLAKRVGLEGAAKHTHAGPGYWPDCSKLSRRLVLILMPR
jgi:hypothetical protein